MQPKTTSLLLDIVENAINQLQFVANELTDAKADAIEKECGFHESVRESMTSLKARRQREERERGGVA